MKSNETMSEFVQMNLANIIEEHGEDNAKIILSGFCCPLNKDLENFFRCRAIEFSKRGLAQTHLVYWVTEDEKEKELIGCFTIASKYIEIAKDGLSERQLKKIKSYSRYDAHSKKHIIPAPLIAHLGKNFNKGNDTLISGDELLKMALEKIEEAQKIMGGRYTYLECEDKQTLIEFYERNGFVQFGKRKLDKDETNIETTYLIQMMKYMK